MNRPFLYFIFAAMVSCTYGKAQINFSLNRASKSLPHLYGRKNAGSYLYTTAGDRLYAIGDQFGNFPPTGFHVPGEMGGVWQQPIKLLDGFDLKITDGERTQVLNACDSFITYPFTTSFVYTNSVTKLSIIRTQFVPDGKPVLVVEYSFTNNSNEDKQLDIEFTANVNLMPVWLGERSGMVDSPDKVISFSKKTNTLLAKDENNAWYTAVASADLPVDLKASRKSDYQNKKLSVTLAGSMPLAKGKTRLIHFYISGSLKNPEEIKENILATASRLPELFNAKKERYRQLDRNASIQIPDKGIMQAYQWGKYSSDWLIRDVPGLGRAMSAGLPDYPWFFSNDQASTFNALLGTIEPELFYSSWKMLKKISDQANDSSGRIIHEVSSNGVVYDKGRMEESQLHIIAAWNIFRWTGDRSFLKENYEYGKKIWTWLQLHDNNKNGYIEGYGGVEIEGLNEEMLDVQVHTYTFLSVMSKMSSVVGDSLAAADYQLRADRLKAMINKDWWVPEENRYADFISSKQKAVQIIDTALSKRVHNGRNEWARRKLTQLKSSIEDNNYHHKGYVVYYNGSGILPVEEGMADTAAARAVLAHIYWFNNKFGMYITGIERPDNLSVDEGNFRHDSTFNYNRAVMPGATAGIVIAACRYGYIDTALKYMHTLLNSFNYATPGTMYEVSPDYGMFAQAWNITGFNVPIIQYFFGIDPMAMKKKIFLHPAFPSEWKNASISNVIIGDNLFSLQYNKSAKEITYRITSSQPQWSFALDVPAGARVLINGKKIIPQNSRVLLKGQRNIVNIQQQ